MNVWMAFDRAARHAMPRRSAAVVAGLPSGDGVAGWRRALVTAARTAAVILEGAIAPGA